MKELTVGGFIPLQLQKDFVGDNPFLSPHVRNEPLYKGNIVVNLSYSGTDLKKNISKIIRHMHSFTLAFKGYQVVNKRGRNKLRIVR